MDLNLPLLPLRDIVVFPGMVVPLFVGRDKSVVALEKAMAANKEIFLVAQLDPAEDDPDKDDLYTIGVTATIMQLLKLPDGTVRVLVEGKQRAELRDLVDRGSDFVEANISLIADIILHVPEVTPLMRPLHVQFQCHSNPTKNTTAETPVQRIQT